VRTSDINSTQIIMNYADCFILDASEVNISCASLFLHGSTALVCVGLPHCRGFMITLRHTTLGRTPLDLWSARRPTSAWQHTTLTINRHPCSRGIRSRNLSSRAAADPRLRPRGHWDRLPEIIEKRNFAVAQVVYVNWCRWRVWNDRGEEISKQVDDRRWMTGQKDAEF
jgi:hypothetical protein